MVLLGKLLPAGPGRGRSFPEFVLAINKNTLRVLLILLLLLLLILLLLLLLLLILLLLLLLLILLLKLTATTTSTARAGASLHWVVMVAKVAHARGARSACGHLKKGPRFEEFGWLHGALLQCCKIAHK